MSAGGDNKKMLACGKISVIWVKLHISLHIVSRCPKLKIRFLQLKKKMVKEMDLYVIYHAAVV